VFRFGSLFLVLVFAVPRAADADWLFGGFMGASATSSNTLTFTPAAGPATSLANVAYKGQAFRSPIYFGYRIGWMPGDHGLGVEFEFTHAKAIAIETGSADLTQFQQSHGLNFLLANAVYRTSPACDGRCVASLRAGAGISRPHVETTVRNVHQEQYQYGGIAWQLGAGLEYRVWRFAYALADARVTRVTETHLRGPGAEIAGTFFTRHVDFGVGLRFPPR
jgi:hypothetical protein